MIELVRSLVPASPSWVQLGIGDDAAVIEPERNRLEVLTTDVVIEGVHFDRAFCDPASIGHKALAVNLSDLAAMGAAPRAALLSLGLPGTLPMADLEAMLRGLMELAALHKVTLIGGNVARSPGPLFLDVTLTGTVKRRRVLTRQGGRVGDALYVTGSLGAAAAGLAWLRREAAGAGGTATAGKVRPPGPPGPGRGVGRRQRGRGPVSQAAAADAVRPDRRPDAGRHGLHGPERRPGRRRPSAGPGQWDRGGRRGGGPARSPWSDRNILWRVQTFSRAGPLQAALSAPSGGEDYELLLAVSRRSLRRFLAVQRLSGVPVTRIGTLTAGADLVLRREGIDEPLPAGFEHFA